MNPLRRSLLKGTGAVSALLAAGLLKPVFAADWKKEAFEAKSTADALKAIGATPATHKDIVIEASEIAEDGRQVPFIVTSNIPGTEAISILVDKNPLPLAATFFFSNGALPFVRVPLKMGDTSQVRVVVKAAGKTYVASKEIKVTVGGCGG